MSILVLLLWCWAAMVVIMTLLWLVAQRTRDAGIVDVGWAAGIGAAVIFYATQCEGYAPRIWIITIIAVLWSWRLALYLLLNRVVGAQEDGRYQTLREKWGPSAGRYFFLFFQVQASWVVLFSAPILAAMVNGQAALSWLDFAGIAVAALALSGEALADRQLARFRAEPNNRGRTCRQGLWAWSRHPNYFFEWLHWWAYVLLGTGSAYWYVILAGPVLMLLFLFKVTGIPYTEAQALKSRGDDYRDYQKTTSMFVPWFPTRKEQT